jgi:hypothetical protein
MGGVLYFLGLYFAVPILLAKVVLGASFYAILVAYAVWFGMLLLWGFSSTSTLEEAVGWPIIMGMFLTIPALPVVLIGLKFAGIR